MNIKSKKWDLNVSVGRTGVGKFEKAVEKKLAELQTQPLPLMFGKFLYEIGKSPNLDAAAAKVPRLMPSILQDFKTAEQDLLRETSNVWAEKIGFLKEKIKIEHGKTERGFTVNLATSATHVYRYILDTSFKRARDALNTALFSLSNALENRAKEPEVYFEQVLKLLNSTVFSDMAADLAKPRLKPEPYDEKAANRLQVIRSLAGKYQDKWRILQPLVYQTITEDAVGSISVTRYEDSKTLFKRLRSDTKSRCGDVQTGFVNWKIGIIFEYERDLKWIIPEVSLLMFEAAGGQQFTANGIVVDPLSPEMAELRKILESYLIDKRSEKDECSVHKK